MRSKRIAGARRASPRACGARSTRRAGRARTTGRRGLPCCRSSARRCCKRVDAAVGDAVVKAVSGARLNEAEIVRLFAARDADYEHVDHRGRCAAPVGQRRRRALRGQPQHQLHQHLLLSLQVLRVLQGQDARGAARHAVRSGAGRGGAAFAGGVGARRDGSVPARRHPSRLHRRDLCRHLPRDQGRAAGYARARVLAAGGDAGRRDARAVAARFPVRS